MKIVNRVEFLKLPENTVFSKYEPCFFSELCIKGDSLDSNDFFYQQIADSIDAHDSGEFAYKLHNSEMLGTDISFDFNCQSRDGCFDDGQLFAVWDEKDVIALISRLQECVKGVE